MGTESPPDPLCLINFDAPPPKHQPHPTRAAGPRCVHVGQQLQGEAERGSFRPVLSVTVVDGRG